MIEISRFIWLFIFEIQQKKEITPMLKKCELQTLIKIKFYFPGDIYFLKKVDKFMRNLVLFLKLE